MSHIMKSATIRDLRYNFPEIEARLQKGEEIEIRKRKRVIARLVPIRPKLEHYPDFAAIRKEIFGDKKVSQTGTELVAQDRDRF
jgi:antitoxin (DNA-binding transcriptional repressor) of toxin-antitoxin stability system